MILHLRARATDWKLVTIGKDYFNSKTLDLSPQPFSLCVCIEDAGIGQGGDIMKA